jgi:hypothetical protein
MRAESEAHVMSAESADRPRARRVVLVRLPVPPLLTPPPLLPVLVVVRRLTAALLRLLRLLCLLRLLRLHRLLRLPRCLVPGACQALRLPHFTPPRPLALITAPEGGPSFVERLFNRALATTLMTAVAAAEGSGSGGGGGGVAGGLPASGEPVWCELGQSRMSMQDPPLARYDCAATSLYGCGWRWRFRLLWTYSESPSGPYEFQHAHRKCGLSTTGATLEEAIPVFLDSNLALPHPDVPGHILPYPAVT